MGFIVFVGYVQGWTIRRPIELILVTSHIMGTVFFMGTELYDGLQNVPPKPNNVGGPNGLFEHLTFDTSSPKFESQFAFFWFAYLACNSAWYYVPYRLGLAAYNDIVHALETQKS